MNKNLQTSKDKQLKKKNMEHKNYVEHFNGLQNRKWKSDIIKLIHSIKSKQMERRSLVNNKKLPVGFRRHSRWFIFLWVFFYLLQLWWKADQIFHSPVPLKGKWTCDFSLLPLLESYFHDEIVLCDWSVAAICDKFLAVEGNKRYVNNS